MSVFTEHTHTAAFYWRRSGYFGGKVVGARVRTFPSRSRRTGISWIPIAYARSAQAARKRGVLFAHLKCAPVRRALSATDSVCSLLQDGGSAPIHFLLIASQLSLSIRIKTRRFPAEPPGRSYSISSLTNGGRRRGLGPVLLCFSYVPIQRWMWSFQRWLHRSPTWSSVCVCAPLFPPVKHVPRSVTNAK